MATRIQLRRDTSANWTSANPTLAAGEFGYETNTGKWKVGDGATAWTSLAYQPTSPTSSTDNTVPRFDGTSGRALQGSGVVVDDSNNVSGLGTVGCGAVTSTGAVQAAAASGFVIGSSGPKLPSGTGNPEGVVTAPVGSIWFQTDSAVGVTHWRKAAGSGSTGWVVMSGDTGVRDISASHPANANGWASTTHQIRRIGNTVQYYALMQNASGSTVTNASTGITLPSGFRPSMTVDIPIMGNSTTTFREGAVITSGGVYINGYASVTAFAFSVTWLTGDAWPSTLPGS